MVCWKFILVGNTFFSQILGCFQSVLMSHIIAGVSDIGLGAFLIFWRRPTFVCATIAVEEVVVDYLLDMTRCQI